MLAAIVAGWLLAFGFYLVGGFFWLMMLLGVSLVLAAGGLLLYLTRKP